jgi:hypothetical protein
VLRLNKKGEINPYNYQLERLLSGGDLRSIGKVDSVISRIKNQSDFDELFKCLFHQNRIVVMRAADAIEKIATKKTQYLTKHKRKIIKLFYVAENKELKWHLALIIPRLQLDNKELTTIWNGLTAWAKDKTNSRLVRVAAVQGLFEMVKQKNNLMTDLILTMNELERENISSINARIRNIRKETT